MLVLTLSASVLMGCGKTRKKEYAMMSPEESKEYNAQVLQNMKNKDKGKKKKKRFTLRTRRLTPLLQSIISQPSIK